jgi:hypothetical protein
MEKVVVICTVLWRGEQPLHDLVSEVFQWVFAIDHHDDGRSPHPAP